MTGANSDKYARIRKMIRNRMVLIPAIPFLLVIAGGYAYSAFFVETRTVASLQRVVADHSQSIDGFLRERRSNLEFVSRTHSFESLKKPKQLAFVYDNLRVMSSAFVDLGIFDEKGLHMAYHGPHQLSGRVYGDEPWFTEVMREGAYISDMITGFRGYPHFIIAVARKENGRTWVLRATIDPHIFKNMVERIRLDRSGEAYIVNKRGYFQTELRSNGLLLDLDSDRDEYLKYHDGVRTFIGNRDLGGAFGAAFTPGGKDAYLYTTTWLEEKPWLLVVRQKKQDAFGNLRVAMYLAALGTITGLVVIIGLAFSQAGGIVRQIRRMDRENQAVEKQHTRTVRLVELGRMSAGFANEINTPLQVIRGEQALMEYIARELRTKSQGVDDSVLAELEGGIAQISAQVDRCAYVTQAIMKFGGQGGSVDMEDIDVRIFIPEIIDIYASRTDTQEISIKQLVAGDGPFLVAGDKVRLQQVLFKLLNNAVDAVRAKTDSLDGEILIYTGPADHGEVEISVQDNGIGISAENLQRIFTPFYSTKSASEREGLGLAICYGIVEGLGGKISVSSYEDLGTTVTMVFPATHHLEG